MKLHQDWSKNVHSFYNIFYKTFLFFSFRNCDSNLLFSLSLLEKSVNTDFFFSGPYFPAFGLNTDQKKLRIWTLHVAYSLQRSIQNPVKHLRWRFLQQIVPIFQSLTIFEESSCLTRL